MNARVDGWGDALRPRQNDRHFADDIFKCISLNENICLSIKDSLKFVLEGPINNIPGLFQIMVWCRPGDKPLSEPMMVSSLKHICVTRSQWVLTLMWCQQMEFYPQAQQPPSSRLSPVMAVVILKTEFCRRMLCMINIKTISIENTNKCVH